MFVIFVISVIFDITESVCHIDLAITLVRLVSRKKVPRVRIARECPLYIDFAKLRTRIVCIKHCLTFHAA